MKKTFETYLIAFETCKWNKKTFSNRFENFIAGDFNLVAQSLNRGNCDVKVEIDQLLMANDLLGTDFLFLFFFCLKINR